MSLRSTKGKQKSVRNLCKNKIRKNVVENKRLCVLVQQQPLVYDSAHKDYGQQRATEEAWQAIAVSWGKSVTKCKIRWRNLRAAYARSIEAYTTKRGPNRERPYYLARHMEFLKPHLCNEAAAAAAGNAETVVNVVQSNPLETSANNATLNDKRHSEATGNENHRVVRIIQNIRREMQDMNQTEQKTYLTNLLKHITMLLIYTTDEQELLVLLRVIEERLNQGAKTLKMPPVNEVTVKNEPLEPI